MLYVLCYMISIYIVESITAILHLLHWGIWLKYWLWDFGFRKKITNIIMLQFLVFSIFLKLELWFLSVIDLWTMVHSNDLHLRFQICKTFLRPSFFITQDSYQQTWSSLLFFHIFNNNFFNMEIHDHKNNIINNIWCYFAHKKRTCFIKIIIKVHEMIIK